MESQYFHSLAGQEVDEPDINSVSENGALADDRLMAELLRLLPYDGATVRKAVIPYGLFASGGASPKPNLAVVGSSLSANAQTFVRPFRAIIGSRTTLASDAKQNWRDLRSAIVIGTTTLHQVVSHSATSANHRWDLIYAKVDVDQDQASVTRYVKDPSTEAISAQSVAVRKATTVTIGKVEGSEGATPSRPALPADSGSSYYIPLAYVFIRHAFTTGTQVDPRWIHEVSPCAPINSAWGVPHIAPVNHAHKVGGTLLTADDWDGTNLRPQPHLPPTMFGGVQRFIGMDYIISSGKWPALNTTSVIDDSIDWRNRWFLWFAMVSGAGAEFGWTPGIVTSQRVPSAFHNATAQGANRNWGWGQSFYFDASTPSGGRVALLNNTVLSALAASSSIDIIVDSATGNLVATVGSTNPDARVFLALMASGPFDNAAT